MFDKTGAVLHRGSCSYGPSGPTARASCRVLIKLQQQLLLLIIIMIIIVIIIRSNNTSNSNSNSESNNKSNDDNSSDKNNHTVCVQSATASSAGYAQSRYSDRLTQIFRGNPYGHDNSTHNSDSA